jgi:hypothetical protein
MKHSTQKYTHNEHPTQNENTTITTTIHIYVHRRENLTVQKGFGVSVQGRREMLLPESKYCLSDGLSVVFSTVKIYNNLFQTPDDFGNFSTTRVLRVW